MEINKIGADELTVSRNDSVQVKKDIESVSGGTSSKSVYLEFGICLSKVYKKFNQIKKYNLNIL